MNPKNILDISDRNDLREWYLANHDNCGEFWIRVNRAQQDCPGVIRYVDAVEVALCFGWIDSTLKRIDEGKAVQRFSPRRKGSSWCEINIGRCRRLIASGEMTESGYKVLPQELK